MMSRIKYIILLLIVISIYASPVFLFESNLKLTNLYEEPIVIVGGSAGFCIHSLYFGASGYTTIGDLTFNDIETSELCKLNRFSYAGLDVRYIPKPIGSLFNLSTHCLFGAGVADYCDDDLYFTPKESDNELFITIEPRFDLTINITNSVRLGYGISYRSVFSSDVEFYDSKTFSGFSSNIVAQFGKL